MFPDTGTAPHALTIHELVIRMTNHLPSDFVEFSSVKEGSHYYQLIPQVSVGELAWKFSTRSIRCFEVILYLAEQYTRDNES